MVKMLSHCSNMQKHNLHHFCNSSSSDDGPKMGKKVLGIYTTMDNT